jgi:hypothetical protein
VPLIGWFEELLRILSLILWRLPWHQRPKNFFTDDHVPCTHHSCGSSFDRLRRRTPGTAAVFVDEIDASHVKSASDHVNRSARRLSDAQIGTLSARRVDYLVIAAQRPSESQ